jgi:hypothetical protein
MNSIYISYILYTHGLKVVLNNIFKIFVLATKFRAVGFATCNVRSMLKNSDFGASWIRGLGLLDLSGRILFIFRTQIPFL